MAFLSEQILFYLSLLVVLILPGWFLLDAIFLLSQNKNNKKYQPKKERINLFERVSLSVSLSIIVVNFLLLATKNTHILLDGKNILIIIGSFIFLTWLFSRRANLVDEWEDINEKKDIYKNKIKIKRAKTLVAILTLFLLGPLWALSSPQTKFVSGGVIGNVIGNLIIPTALYFYLRALQEKSKKFLILGFFSTLGLFYIHHLSSFVFLFIVLFILLTNLLFYLIINFWPSLKWFQINIIDNLSFNNLKKEDKNQNNSEQYYNFSKIKKRKTYLNHKIITSSLIILIFFLTISIRVLYLEKTIFPTATDLGHHLYWSSQIVANKHIVPYQKLAILEKNNHYFLEKKRIADFIIGEHLIFVAIHLISNISFVSYFPTLVLFFINLATLLVIFNLVYYILPEEEWLILTKNKINLKKDENDFLFVSKKTEKIKEYFKLFFNPYVFLFLTLSLAYIYFIYLPSYLQIHAVKTAVGTPSKATRAGYTWSEIKYQLSGMRFVLFLGGFFIVSFFTFFRRFPILNASLIIGWLSGIFLMVWRPQWLYINIPSGRLITYLIFPVAILNALAFVFFFLKKKDRSVSYWFTFLGYLILGILIFSGVKDNIDIINKTKNTKNQLALATFHTAQYLSKKIDVKKENIVKDHNYLVADTWMKIFFHQDYNYPLSRGYFKRYQDKTKSREHCTLWMISEPNSQEAQKCYQDLKIKYIIINPQFDKFQFENSNQFWKVYDGKEIAIYRYNPF